MRPRLDRLSFLPCILLVVIVLALSLPAVFTHAWAIRLDRSVKAGEGRIVVRVVKVRQPPRRGIAWPHRTARKKP